MHPANRETQPIYSQKAIWYCNLRKYNYCDNFVYGVKYKYPWKIFYKKWTELTSEVSNKWIKETLNKSLYTSCLHIFRQFAQKILRVRSVFLRFFERTDEKSDGTICANDLISVSQKTRRFFYEERRFKNNLRKIFAGFSQPCSR